MTSALTCAKLQQDRYITDHGRGQGSTVEPVERRASPARDEIPGSTDRRRHVGLTVPREVKAGALEAAEVLGWPAGQWVLTAAAEHGPRLREGLAEDLQVPKRAAVRDAAFMALYLTADERDELDDQATACGLNRSAFVTAVVRLALGDDLDPVVADLRGGTGHDEASTG